MKPADKLNVITCCIPRDLPLARLAVDGMIRHLSCNRIVVATPASAFSQCRHVLGSDVDLIDERDLTCGVSLQELRAEPVFAFPERAGWYLQQFAKFGYAFMESGNPHYLIWDSDTIPLRSFEFFAPDGRPFYTMAKERTEPYFETYERLFGYRPSYPGSFISQHMVIDRSLAREMLNRVTERYPQERNWVWAIMRHLSSAQSLSLFSEYETYGNYVHTHYPDRIALRELPWLREGAGTIGGVQPTSSQLETLAHQYYFAAFETWQVEAKPFLRRRFLASLRKLLSSGSSHQR